MPRPMPTSPELSMLITETLYTTGYEMTIYIKLSLVNINKGDRVNAVTMMIMMMMMMMMEVYF